MPGDYSAIGRPRDDSKDMHALIRDYMITQVHHLLRLTDSKSADNQLPIIRSRVQVWLWLQLIVRRL